MSMQALMAASQSMARMQTMQSARTQMQGTANVLCIESKQDGGNQKKLDAADALDEKSSDLMGNLMDEINDVNETLKPDEETKAEEAKEAEKKSPRTDTIELSDSATKQLGKESDTNPAVLAAVTYKADGSVRPDEPNKTAPKFEATA